MGDWAGGAYYVHQSYKPYLCLKPEEWAIGEILVQPGDTSPIVISGLGFRPNVIMMVCHRPQYANGISDSAFGQRGGGMTYGVAGLPFWGAQWDDAVTYQIGDVVSNDGAVYTANAINLNSEPPSADWDATVAVQFTGSTKIKHAFETTHSHYREDVCLSVVHKNAGVPVLVFDLASFDAGGFTLDVPVNLWDGTNYVAWIAMQGAFATGIIDAGDGSIDDVGFAPNGAMFLSSKFTSGQIPNRDQYWDHMVGFASPEAQASIWGGRRPTSWDWSTERWADDESILLCTPASGSSFAGTAVDVVGMVSDWGLDGVDLSWPVYGGQFYRIGYVLCGDPAEAGILETNYQTRPGGLQNVPGTQYNLQFTNMKSPRVILMAGTNYTWSTTNSNSLDMPRTPDTFHFGASGGLGWHAKPFSEAGYDAYGVHTFGNSVAERGHYSNSGTQYLRRSILAGQGSNSNPPAYHQHSVNVIENPVIVGLNYRYGERHSQIKRFHTNISDRYLP
jgi:hypothetical protein